MVLDAETLRARADTEAGRAVEAAWVLLFASERACVDGWRAGGLLFMSVRVWERERDR